MKNFRYYNKNLNIPTIYISKKKNKSKKTKQNHSHSIMLEILMI